MHKHVKWLKERQKGFTIVELLVVIVVISILASVVTVAYSGIQKQAREASFLATFDAYEKGLRIYKEIHGTFPSTGYVGGVQRVVCLGENYPATSDFPEGSCRSADFGESEDTYIVDPAINSSLKSVMSTLPDPHRMSFSFFWEGTNYEVYRGITYMLDPSHSFGSLSYSVSGDVECGRGNKLFNPDFAGTGTAVTQCLTILYN